MVQVGNVSVLFTDLVGSTALASSVTPAEADVLRREHFAVLRGVVAELHGSEVKNLGDGLMVVFPTASAALACAVGMQQATDADNRRREVPFGLRVGVSAGEVSVEDGDYFGDPVVEAARLCARCERGQILAADVVRQMAGRRNPHPCTPLGDLELKGLPAPVPVVEVIWTPLAEDRSSDPGPLMRESPVGGDMSHRPDQREDPSQRDADGMVGRATDLARALAACRSLPGSTSVLIVNGPAGMGKTRLLEETRRLVVAGSADGAVPLWLVGGCDDGLDFAFQPFVTALRSLPVGELVEHAEALPAALRRSLGKVLPELLPGDADDSNQGTREGLFEAVRLMLDGLGRTRSVTIVTEDLHWCSPDTAELIRFLLATPPSRGITLGLTYRSTDVADAHPLHGVVAAARRRGAVEVSLDRLSATEVAAVVRRAVPDLDDAVVEVIVERSSGSPLFAVELARDASQRGGPAVDAVPPGIAGIVHERLQRLTPLGRRLVQVGSLVGQTFTLDVVATVEEVSGPQALDALEPAIGAGLIVEADASGRFTFSHALMHDAVAATVAGPTRQGMLMWRVGEAAERSYLLDPRARIELRARGLCAGAETGDPRRAVDAAMDAGHVALAAFDASAALEAFDLARSVLERCAGRVDDPAMCAHRAELGRSRSYLLLAERGLEGAVEASRRALDLVANRDDPSLVLDCIDVVAHCRAIFQAPLETVDLCREATEAVRDAPAEVRAMVSAAWASAHCITYTGRRVDVASRFEEAVAIADRIEDGRARRWVYGLAVESGADGLGLSFEHIMREYFRLGIDDESPQGRAMAAVTERRAAMLAGTAGGAVDAEAATAVVDRAAAVAVEQFDADFAARIDNVRMSDLLRSGRLDDLAEHLFHSGKDRSDLERVAGRLRWYYAAHHVGELRYHRDELPDLVDSIAQLVDGSSIGVQRLNWSGGYALSLLDAGRAEDAAHVLDVSVVEGFDDIFVGTASIIGWFTEAAWTCGHLDALEACFDRLGLLSGVDGPLAQNGVHGSATLWSGLAAGGLGRIDDADGLLAIAAEQFARTGMPLFCNLARAFRSRILSGGGRASRSEAQSLAADASSDAARVGQHRVSRLVAPVLAS